MVDVALAAYSCGQHGWGNQNQEWAEEEREKQLSIDGQSYNGRDSGKDVGSGVAERARRDDDWWMEQSGPESEVTDGGGRRQRDLRDGESSQRASGLSSELE